MGLSVLLDTNAIISLLKNENTVLKIVSEADLVLISIVNEIEFKSFSNLTDHDLKLLDKLLEHVLVIDLKTGDKVLLERIYNLRKTYQIKLPDAIIDAAAIVHDANLITADRGFSKINGLKLVQI